MMIQSTGAVENIKEKHCSGLDSAASISCSYQSWCSDALPVEPWTLNGTNTIETLPIVNVIFYFTFKIEFVRPKRWLSRDFELRAFFSTPRPQPKDIGGLLS